MELVEAHRVPLLLHPGEGDGKKGHPPGGKGEEEEEKEEEEEEKDEEEEEDEKEEQGHAPDEEEGGDKGLDMHILSTGNVKILFYECL